MTAEDLVALMSANAGTPTERAIAVLAAAGVTSSDAIAKALGLTVRAVQLARKQTAHRAAQVVESEVGFAKQTSLAKQVSPESEVGFATPPTDSRARAYKESPSEISTSLNEGVKSPLSVEEPSALIEERDEPHLNGRGFIVSGKHNIVIPMETYDGWKARFPALPDLEAVVANLSSKILARGCMHAGWQYPSSWMVKILADENKKAENAEREAKAREARAAGSLRSAGRFMDHVERGLTT